MVFTGTLDKCKACDKTVYVVDLVTADGVPYHKTCFRCSHCNGKLMVFPLWMESCIVCHILSNNSEKLVAILAINLNQNKTSSKLSSMFSGTQDKCATCKKTAYPLESSCFRCAKGGCNLTTSNYAALDGFLYCKPHFSQLFKEKGSYSHLTKSVSGKKNDTATSSDEDKLEASPKIEQ
ncbi:LIM domain-containing protein PLIM2c [Bienertia sinuspersici]